MGSIQEITGTNGKKGYRLQIRKNKKEINKSFPDIETANIFVAYHEMLLDLEKFEAKDQDLYTLGSILSMKYSDTSREMSEIKLYFTDYFLIPIRKFDFKFLMEIAKNFLSKKSQKGGIKGNMNTGIVKDISPNTVIRKLSYISSSINHAIAQGIDIENHVLRVISYVRSYQDKSSED